MEKKETYPRVKKNTREKKKPRKPWQKAVLTAVLIIVGIPLLYVIFGLTLMTVTEYQPAAVEEVIPEGDAAGEILTDTTYRIGTWNIGYGALGDNADFFLDGGSSVKTADRARTEENMEAIASAVKETLGQPALLLLQEADTDSTRSNHVDEYRFIADRLTGYNETFAYNYRVVFLPYPMPPIGRVNAGLATYSQFTVTDATRIQLPNPFSWPWRQGNLKRCIVIHHIPVSGSKKELAVVNLHLEAYDSGEGKIAQTKMLREYLTAEVEKGNYVIAGGDFNQIFSNVDSSAYPVYEGKWQPGVIDAADFPAGFQLIMDEAVPSCRSLDQPYEGADRDTFQYYIIDGFIVSENVEIEAVETKDLDFQASDHNPVLLTFRLKP